MRRFKSTVKMGGGWAKNKWSSVRGSKLRRSQSQQSKEASQNSSEQGTLHSNPSVRGSLLAERLAAFRRRQSEGKHGFAGVVLQAVSDDKRQRMRKAFKDAAKRRKAENEASEQTHKFSVSVDLPGAGSTGNDADNNPEGSSSLRVDLSPELEEEIEEALEEVADEEARVMEDIRGIRSANARTRRRSISHLREHFGHGGIYSTSQGGEGASAVSRLHEAKMQQIEGKLHRLDGIEDKVDSLVQAMQLMLERQFGPQTVNNPLNAAPPAVVLPAGTAAQKRTRRLSKMMQKQARSGERGRPKRISVQLEPSPSMRTMVSKPARHTNSATLV